MPLPLTSKSIQERCGASPRPATSRPSTSSGATASGPSTWPMYSSTTACAHGQENAAWEAGLHSEGQQPSTPPKCTAARGPPVNRGWAAAGRHGRVEPYSAQQQQTKRYTRRHPAQAQPHQLDQQSRQACICCPCPPCLNAPHAAHAPHASMLPAASRTSSSAAVSCSCRTLLLKRTAASWRCTAAMSSATSGGATACSACVDCTEAGDVAAR